MSTNPTIIPAWITSWEAFVKAHERMFLILGGIAIITFGVLKISSLGHQYLDNKHLEAQAQTNQQIAVQEQKTQALEATIAQLQQSYAALQQTTLAAIAAQKQVVVVQQEKNNAMTPDELSQRWATLIKVGNAALAPQKDGSINVSNEAAHITVNQLETIPELNQEITLTNTQLKACEDLNGKKDEDISGLKNQVALEKQGRADDAKVAKDAQRKSFWKGTKFGAAVTAVAIAAIKILIVVK